MAEGRGEAPMAADKGTEVSMAKRQPEDPALTVLLMEQICQRENLRKALQRVRQNKGSPGIDGMTVNKLPRYLKKHWPQIREQLLAVSYSKIRTCLISMTYINPLNRCQNLIL